MTRRKSTGAALRSNTYKAPKGRPDGELYARPEPNPFTPEWNDGYQDGYDSKRRKPDQDLNYKTGYAAGVEDRETEKEELDRASSSNT